MVSPRIREVQDKQEMQRVVDDFMTQGYTIKEEGMDTTLLKKEDVGISVRYHHVAYPHDCCRRRNDLCWFLV